MKVTIKGLIHKSQYGDKFDIFSSDMTEYGYVLVGPAEFEYEVPADFNPVAAEVASLEKKLDTLADEYQKQSSAIKSRIKDLQCIGYAPDMPDEVNF